MGMFDYVEVIPPIKCECGKELEDFQTKGGPCIMTTFRIKDGQLEEEDWKLETNPEYEVAKKDGTLKDKWIAPLMKKSFGWKQLKDTDTLYFYTSCHECGNWIDVEAVIVDGKVRPLKIEYCK